VSPQRSNRQALLDGTLRCVARLPPEAVTARVIAAESGANLQSIVYHFGSKDRLLAEAILDGFRGWIAELTAGLAELAPGDSAARLRRAIEIVQAGRRRHAGLVRAFFAALARAAYDENVRATLAQSYAEARVGLAAALGLGDDAAARDLAGLLIATFDGALIQATLDPALELDPARLAAAGRRLAALGSRTTASGGFRSEL
jgi:AcrR family transcriptional regulator